MNTDIKEMFSEKNQSLFFNKLIMDLENNTDTFKLATKNIVKIEIAKLLSSLRKIYYSFSVPIDEEKVKELLSLTKNSLLTDINILIDKKYDGNSDFIKDKDEPINSKYVKSYHKHIDKVESEFEGSLKLAVCEQAEIVLYTELIKLYPCVNEDMQQEMLKKINLDFSNTMINRIVDESVHRNRTLKNMSDETYKSYLNLNKNSSKIEKNSKIKVIKNN